MYVGIPENRILVTIIESISADGKYIPPVIIVLSKMIIASWFYENIEGNEVITVFITGYTNDDICKRWLDYFIFYNNYGLDKLWRILLLDGQLCYKAPRFILKAKANKIWLIKFLSYQTYLL